MQIRTNGSWVSWNYSIMGQNAATVENSKTIPIYSNSHNLFGSAIEQGRLIVSSGVETSATNRVRSTFDNSPLSKGTYTINAENSSFTVNVSLYIYDSNKNFVSSASITDWQAVPFTFTLTTNSYVRFVFRVVGDRDITPNDISNVMLNSGSTVLPYEPYYKPLVSYSFEGQCSQASTPTPTVPVEVEEFGNHIPDIGSLNAIGEHIDSLNLATGLYSHKIKQIIFDGSENWTNAGIAGLSRMSIALSDAALVRDSVCSHYIYDPDNLNVNNHCFITSTLSTFMFCDNTNATDLTKWTTFLATQYANGTPLTVWYILETPTTETLTIGSGLSGIEEGYTIQTGTPTPSSPQMPQTNNIGGKTIIQITSAGQTQNIILSEPLRKIGNYADSVNNDGVVTRRIKKLVLNGTETIGWYNNLFYIRVPNDNALLIDGVYPVISSHYTQMVTTSDDNSVRMRLTSLWSSDTPAIQIKQSSITQSQQGMADYLASQYINGTPVIVYYVLATPTTESYSKNIFTSAPVQTTTLNGVTCVSDGQGRYSLSGTSSATALFEFTVPEFTVPESVGNGGTGTFSIFNDFTQRYISLQLYNDSTKVTEWICDPQSRTSTAYSEMSNKKVNKIVIRISNGVAISGTAHLSPMITNDSTLPSTFDTYRVMPTIPTSSGYSNIEIGTSLASSKFTYDLGKMFMPQEGKVRVNGEWV